MDNLNLKSNDAAEEEIGSETDALPVQKKRKTALDKLLGAETEHVTGLSTREELEKFFSEAPILRDCSSDWWSSNATLYLVIWLKISLTYLPHLPHQSVFFL